jgi:DNA-binding LytR/AlgR family response regulator
MPALTGIELAKSINEDVTIIFTTAFDSFALQGYNLNAVDYLLKPFTLERFNVAVTKAVKFNASRFTDQAKSNFITVRADYSLMKIELAAIKYIEGLDDYIKIHLNNAKTVVTRYTMKSILEALPENQFIRVHRSYIVPLNKIKAVKNRVVVIEECELPLGQSFESNVLKYFS